MPLSFNEENEDELKECFEAALKSDNLEVCATALLVSNQILTKKMDVFNLMHSQL